MKRYLSKTKQFLTHPNRTRYITAAICILSMPLFAADSNPLHIDSADVEQLKGVTKSIQNLLMSVFLPAAGIISSIWAVVSSFFKQSLQPLLIFGVIALVCFFLPTFLKLVFQLSI